MSLPLQVIADVRPFRTYRIDLSALPAARGAEEMDGVPDRLADLPWDPTEGAPLRAAFLTLPGAGHALALALPALCADAATLDNLAREIVSAFACERGERAEPEPPLQYTDLAEWQNQLLESPDTAAAIERWREEWRDHGLTARLGRRLPLERALAPSHPGEAPFSPAVVPVPVAPDLSATLEALFRAFDLPAASLLLAVWQVVLWQGTGEPEVLTGFLHDGRSYEELETALGPFARYLPIHGRIDEAMSLRDLAAAVRDAIAAAAGRQESFSWKLVAGEGSPSSTPDFFPVCFVWEEEPPLLRAAGLEMSLVRRSAVADRFRLECGGRIGSKGFSLELRYDRSAFHRHEVERLAERLLALLRQVAAQPDARLADLGLPGERELQWIGRIGRGAPVDGAEDRLHRLFEAQAERTPLRPAVVGDEVELTYAELNARANQLAHHLSRLGVGIETPVALCLERSPAAVVAILAVLKAGGFWIPLDPRHPPERLAFVLADTAAPVVVTTSSLVGIALEGRPGLRKVLLDVGAPATAACPAGNHEGGAAGGNLAYTIYTSGSTGVPKGVQVEHRAAAQLLRALTAAVAELGRGPLRVSLNAPLTFDASVQQLVLLLAGHTLHIVPEAVRTDGPALLSFLRAGAVDLFDCTPSQLRILLGAGLLEAPGPVPGVVLTAGEAIDAPLWESLLRSRRTVFFNLYGPTECTVDATAHRIGSGTPAPTIGRPLAGYEVLLLDRDLRPVPVGAPGEIGLGGAGLARGYSGRPALTAERFVPHPWGGRPGERLYRTGDLARWLPDGNLEFLGRVDNQIKLRGYRIEPGEIEAALALHPWVEEAVVVVREQPGLREDVRLVAYVRPAAAAPAGLAGAHAELQGFLRQRLPEAMVPASFVPLASFPWTTSGKVDRRALASRDLAPAAGRPELTTGFVAPGTPFEEVLAAIWQEVLGLERVGARDNFFELGGHSLLATQVIQRARAVLCGSLSVRHLFEQPTVAELAAVAEAEMAAGQGAAPPPIRRSAEPPVLSFAQQRLWFLHQMDPASGTYNIPAAVRCQGRLEPAVLAAALTEIVRRHEVLRTRFEAGCAEGRILFSPAGPIDLPVVDLSGLPEEERRRETAVRVREEARRPFDLEREPLLRSCLLVEGPEEHVALLTMHHIVSDAWSAGVLVQELSALYPALRQGRSPQLPELPIQYSDFARWQREWLSGDVLDAEIAWWRERLGEEVRLELPTDRPRPAVRTFRGSIVSFAIPEEHVAGLRALSRKQGATLFMTLLGAFQALLCRSTCQSQVTVGSPIAGRNQLQTEGLIGFFINTLVLRTDLAGDPFWDVLVARVREVTLGAYLHQDLPFEVLVGELRPERSLSRVPLFEVMFALQNAPAGSLQIPGLTLQQLSVPSEVAKLDLSVSFAETASGLTGLLEYDRDLFDRSTVERLAARCALLLEGLASGPERRLSQLPLLTPGELAQLAEWGRAAGEPPPWSVPDLFAKVADRSPGSLAVEADGEVVTHGELRRRAAGVARRLVAQGVGPGVIVGLCADRSCSLVAGLLGILQAGGAYLPLDPSLPGERLRFVLEDSGARVILASSRVTGDLPEHAARLVVLEDAETAAGDVEAPEVRVAPDDLAYVIYTSGSTGRPKGVLVEHANLASVLAASLKEFGWEAGDRVPCLAPFSFDIFLFELLSPLLAGGACVLLPLRPTLDPEQLLEVLPGATRLHAVPPLMRQIVAAVRREETACPRLRTLFVGGETVPLDLLQEMREVFPQAELRVLYGPTEGTIICTAWTVAAGELPSRSSIGSPLPGVELCLCDPWGGPVPVGSPGEIWIGGAGVTRGYLGRGDLTAERYPILDGRRFYRTGDLARWLPDGSLAFAGRIDEQVKVRGFRIEPGEIEAVLVEHAGVEAAAVMVDAAGGHLVAWLVPAAGGSLGVESVRAFVRERLPDYMVPARFLEAERLPLTRHGKVDRKALAARLAESDRAPAQDAREPRTRAEEVLAGIFAAALRRERVGIEDDFFSLGGDSILVLQVVARARQAGLRMTPGQVFTHPTVAGLASVVQTAASDPMEEETASGPIPLTPVQSLFFERQPASPERFIQTVLLELGTDGEASAVTTGRLRALLAHLVARHDALRLRFEPPAGEEGTWRQVGEAPAEPPPLLLVDLSAVPENRHLEAVETAAGLDPGLDLGRPPLVRAALVARGGAAPDLLLLAIHHLSVDGVSWRVLLEDLETGWRQLAAGGPVALPPRTTSFRRWAEHLAAMAGSAGVREHAGYWLERMDGVPAALPRIAEAGKVHTVRVALDPEETRQLLQEVPRAYRTQVQDVLLAALAEAFAGWAGQRRLWLDLEGHGREELPGESLDVSRTVGWLTSVFPVLLDLEAAPDPGAALKATKEQLRAVPARGLSYGLLRFLGKDGIAERLRSLPAPEVLFNYLGQLDTATPEGGLFRGFRTMGDTGRRLALHAFEITGLVRGGRLWVEWACRHPGAIAERLAERFVARLRELIAHCMSAVGNGIWGYTPSDFPLARLDQASIDHLAVRAGGEIEDVYPVSPLQQGMLLRSLDSPGSGSYVSQVSLTLEADLDVPAFVGAWERVVRRHPILRTAFFARELDEPLQVVRRTVSLDWEHQDWRGEPGTRIQAYLENDRRRGFDPSRAPLLRFALMRLGERRHQLVWTIHHVLLDGWSFPILLREIFALYQAGLRGTEAELTPVRPFRDYIAWLQEQDESASEPFWRDLLAGFTEPTPLGVDLEIPGETRTRDARQIFLPDGETEGLRALARRLGLTLNTLVQGAWAVLLSRYSCGEDVVFGAVSSGRSAPLAGIDGIVGLFINTLPVRTIVTPGERLAPWLERLQERQAAARQHEHCPLARVQSWSEVPPGRRLFDSILAFENYPVDESVRKELGREIGVSGHDVLDQTDYPLTLMAAPAASLRLKLLFDPRRMEGAAMTRLLGHLAALLGSMQADPDVRLRDLPLLTPAERHQLALESRGPRPGRGEWVPLHRRFEAVAREIPDAVAVASPEGALTYAGLDARANHVARRLRRLGIGPDVPVGISAERSLDQIVGVLGILKAGGAYAPLDPSYPAGRLAFMLEDVFSGVASPVLLTQRRFASLLEAAPPPDRIRPAVLCLDEEVSEAEGGTSSSDPEPEQLAYVLYTSGSTGRPKGVALSGGALGNLLDWHRDSGELGIAAHTLQLAPLGFDVSFQEIFSTWVTGGTLHLVTEEVRRDPAALLERLGREGIERIFLPVVALHQLAEAAGHRPGGPVLALRDTVVAGEQLQITPAISAWLHRLPGCRLHNHYGPTEGHVVTTATLRGDSALWPALPSIGRPVTCTDIHLLAPDLEPVPPGVPGELCIGGAQVARGYLGRPSLTAERFVPDPFGSPGSRLYRTGDLARRLPAGDLESMGRIDGQVKIRGFRVEPGEVEVTLAAHPEVRQAAVVVSAPGDGRPRRLVAFFIPEPQEKPEPAELRRFLQQRLPDPLVPSTLVAIESLPRTSSGKVDRRALARMEVGERAGKASFVAPDTALEQWLAGTWSKILQVDKVGAHDDFFELGGHSLLATQVLSRVRRTFQVELPLQVCFEATTLTALARAILDRESRPGQSEKIARALAKVQSMAAVQARQETAGGMTEE